MLLYNIYCEQKLFLSYIPLSFNIVDSYKSYYSLCLHSFNSFSNSTCDPMQLANRLAHSWVLLLRNVTIIFVIRHLFSGLARFKSTVLIFYREIRHLCIALYPTTSLLWKSMFDLCANRFWCVCVCVCVCIKILHFKILHHNSLVALSRPTDRHIIRKTIVIGFLGVCANTKNTSL